MSADLQPRVVIEGVGEPVVLDATWECGRCTFINLVEITQCEMCGFCDKSSKFDAASASDASYLTTSVDTSLISGITATPTSTTGASSAAFISPTVTVTRIPTADWKDPFADLTLTSAPSENSLTAAPPVVAATPPAEPWKCSFCDYFPCDASKHVCPVCETARQGAAPHVTSSQVNAPTKHVLNNPGSNNLQYAASASAPAPAPAPAPPVLQRKLSIDTKWTCQYCLFSSNKSSSNKCEIDGLPKSWQPGDSTDPPAESSSGKSEAAQVVKMESSGIMPLELPPQLPVLQPVTWSCSFCHFKFNEDSQSRCNACGKSKFSEVSKLPDIVAPKIVEKIPKVEEMRTTAPSVPSKLPVSTPSPPQPPVLRPKDTVQLQPPVLRPKDPPPSPRESVSQLSIPLPPQGVPANRLQTSLSQSLPHPPSSPPPAYVTSPRSLASQEPAVSVKQGFFRIVNTLLVCECMCLHVCHIIL
jgi:rubredoxin